MLRTEVLSILWNLWYFYRSARHDMFFALTLHFLVLFLFSDPSHIHILPLLCLNNTQTFKGKDSQAFHFSIHALLVIKFRSLALLRKGWLPWARCDILTRTISDISCYANINDENVEIIFKDKSKKWVVKNYDRWNFEWSNYHHYTIWVFQMLTISFLIKLF